jgi:AcrR family transcriptional regulator
MCDGMADLSVEDVNTVELYNVDILSRMRKTGRRPGDSGSKDAIVVAARRRFGQLGYDKTTIRAVADEAGVDPALVLYFFGSKERLFAACVEWPFDPDVEIPAVLGEDPDGAGRRLVALVLRTWDAEEGRNPIVALLRAAMSQEAAEQQLRAFLQTRILAPLTAGLGVDQPDLRGALVAAQLIGLGLTRHVLRLEPLASLDAEAVADLVGPPVQHALTARLPPA